MADGVRRMTETSPVSAMTTTGDPLEKRVDSVGRLMPHVECVSPPLPPLQANIRK